MKRSTPHSSARAQSAFTLVEVLAGIALLSGLLTTVVVGIGKHRVQIRRAIQKMEAVKLADDLLSRWATEAVRIPTAGSGVLQAEGGTLSWQTTETQVAFGNTIVQQIKLVIWDPAHADRGALVEVDVVQSGEPPSRVRGAFPPSLSTSMAVAQREQDRHFP